MSTRPFNDDKPLGWTLSGGRHNRLCRLRGMYGLWYLIGTWGQGRYMDGWSLHVFPDSVRVGGYAGDYKDRVMTESLMSHCLLSIEGRGGHDFGKGFLSKGGFRPSSPIPYTWVKKEFEGGLLKDPDEFLLQVLGFEPTPQGVIEGKARWAKEAADKKAAREAEEKVWHEQYVAKQQAAQEATDGFQKLFSGVEIPQEYKFEIRSTGLCVWRDRSKGPSMFQYYDQATLTTLAEHQLWLAVAKDKLESERVEALKNAEARAAMEAEQKAREDQIAYQKKAIENDLDGLDDLLSKL